MSSGIWMIKYTSVHHLVVGEIIHISLFLNGEHKHLVIKVCQQREAVQPWR